MKNRSEVMYEIAKKQSVLLGIFDGILRIFSPKNFKPREMPESELKVRRNFPVLVKFIGTQPRPGTQVYVQFTKSVNEPRVYKRTFSGVYFKQDGGACIFVPEIVKDFPHVYAEIYVNGVTIEQYFKLVNFEFIVELRSFGISR